jgi:hypothetical protein
VITMLIALGWSRIFPTLAHVDRLEHIVPPASAPAEAATV